MKSIKTIVVDDEKFARERFQQILSKHSEIDVLKLCKDGNEAIQAINSLNPDLVFLDIEMPGQDGFSVIEEIKSAGKPIFIFVTAYGNYALKAFEVDALDYIPKPINEERVIKSLERAKDKLGLESIKKDVNDVKPQNKSNNDHIDQYVVKNGSKVTILKLIDVMWIEGAGNYINLVTDSKKYIARSTLTGFLERLNPKKFFQIHRSTIINIDHVDYFEEQLYGDYLVIMKNDVQLKMSRNYSGFLKSL